MLKSWLVLLAAGFCILSVQAQIPLTDAEWEAIRLRQRLHRERRGQASRLAERTGSHVPLPEGPWVQSAADVSVAGNHLCASLRRNGQQTTQDCGVVEEGHEFANRKGELETAENFPLCENTCIYNSNGVCDDGGPDSTWRVCRYGTDCDDCGKRPVLSTLPGGDWNETARSITLEGRQLCAQLQRVNLSWSFVCTVLEDGQRFTNMDGEFYLIGQECWVLRCPVGYVQRPLDNLTETLCNRDTCDAERDRDLCCEAAEPCSGVQCPDGQVFDIHRFCPSPECVQERDQNLCCVDAAGCAELDCGVGFVPKANLSSLFCLGPACERSRDLDVCCADAAPCGDFVNYSIAECPEGTFLDPDLFCDGTECLAERDVDICCQTSDLCSNFTCPAGYVLIANASSVSCPRYECSLDHDVDRCCDYRAPCSSLECPLPFVLKGSSASTFCLGAACSLADDFETCCEPGMTCGNGTFVGSCAEGYWLNPDNYCLRTPCEEPRDLVPEACCDPADPCNGTISCPLGLTLKAGSGPEGYTFCTGPVCDQDSAVDIAACCTDAAHCRTLFEESDSDGNETDCPWGFVPRNFTAEPDQYCEGIACELPRDRDACCEDAGVCADEITCPFGYVAKTTTSYCDGPVGSCDLDRDLDLCCDVAESCVNYPAVCPQNYVLRPLQYCLATSCEADRDRFECCAIGVAFQFYRFNTTKLRDGAGNGYVIQLSEIAFYFDGSQVSFSTATIAAEGTTDSPAGEEPSNAIDGDLNTKWNDKSTNVPSLLISFTDPEVVVDEYTWATANDIDGRDPVAWILQGSVDGSNWVDLHIIEEGDVAVTTDRKTYLDLMEVGVPCLAYEMVIANATDPPCVEGNIIPSGSGCTASCDDGLTPTPANLACAHGVLAPTEFVCS